MTDQPKRRGRPRKPPADRVVRLLVCLPPDLAKLVRTKGGSAYIQALLRLDNPKE